jgi:cytochrome c551/c552
MITNTRWIFSVLVVVLPTIFTQALSDSRTIQLPAETARLKHSDLAGFTVAQNKCGICHSADYIQYQPPGMTLTQWTAEMKKMQHSYGAPIDDSDIRLLAIYLASVYGDASTVSAEDRLMKVSSATPSSPAGATTPESESAQTLLAANGCLGCHALHDKLVGPSYHDVAAKYAHDAGALAQVEAHVKAGGVGRWGQVPMPPFASLTTEQLETLAKFVLAQH